MQVDWSIVVGAIGSVATAVAAYFAWRSAHVAAEAAKSAEAMTRLEAERRDDELRAGVSGVFLEVRRSDSDWETRTVAVDLRNAGNAAVSDVLVDLTGRDGVGQSRSWRTKVAVLPAGARVSDTLYFPSPDDADAFETTPFGRGTDLDWFVWSLWFDDPAGRHWRATDRGLVTLLSSRPTERSAMEVVTELDLEVEYADLRFGTLHFAEPDEYPDVPYPPPIVPIRRWPYVAATKLGHAVQAGANFLRERW